MANFGGKNSAAAVPEKPVLRLFAIRGTMTNAMVSSVLIGTLLLLLPAADARGEFFNYEDRSGTVHFVDDASKIPQEYRKQLNVRKDEDDDLSEAEQQARREQRRLQGEQAERRNAADRQQRKNREKTAARQEYLRSLVTPVSISGNQIYVRVSLASGGTTTDAVMLLDTGASITLISPAVAERLKITEGEAARVIGVGGRARAKKAVLSEVKVGPARVSSLGVVIVGSNGAFGEGLLGMDFLRAFSYRVDYARGVIVWVPRGNEFEGGVD